MKKGNINALWLREISLGSENIIVEEYINDQNYDVLEKEEEKYCKIKYKKCELEYVFSAL